MKAREAENIGTALVLMEGVAAPTGRVEALVRQEISRLLHPAQRRRQADVPHEPIAIRRIIDRFA